MHFFQERTKTWKSNCQVLWKALRRIQGVSHQHEKLFRLSSQLLSVAMKPFLWVSPQKYTSQSQRVPRQVLCVVCLFPISPPPSGLITQPSMQIFRRWLLTGFQTVTYRVKVLKEQQRALMKHGKDNKMSRGAIWKSAASLEIDGSMVSRNSKMKTIFHLPFLKPLCSSTMQNWYNQRNECLISRNQNYR